MLAFTPGTKLAHDESSVYGRMSDGSFWRKVTVDVANHIRPCAVLSAPR